MDPAPREIERKFLLAERPAAMDCARMERIDQGYLAIAQDGTEVRIRRRGDRHVLTVKSAGSRMRREVEIDIDADDFAALWPLTEGARVEKTRHLVPLDRDRVAEVDIYAGALEGFAVAEVEFGSEADADAFEPPPWLGPEVTEDPRYRNRRLAVQGRPDRPAAGAPLPEEG